MDPPLRRRVLVSMLLLAAALADLPAVYVLVSSRAVSSFVSLSFGFLAMGLAWAAGFELEQRRAWYVKLAAAVGAAQLAGALLPLGLPLWPLVASGALAGAALVLSLVGGNA